MKENLRIINLKVMAFNIIQRKKDMKENGKIINMMDMEYFIFTLLNGIIKENGKMDFLMDMEFYIFLKDLNMKENGIIIKW